MSLELKKGYNMNLFEDSLVLRLRMNFLLANRVSLTGNTASINFVNDGTWYVQKDIALVHISMISSGLSPASTI